jgi:pentatricopeptide repeat protein
MERGEAALVLATQKGVAISADRVQLAKFYFENGELEKALRFMKRIGESDCELSWQVLRLKILDNLNLKKEALLQAKMILANDSTHAVALKALEKFS